MIVVIIAGGSGTRLWPLSTPDYPKHLLKINSEQRSLLQNTVTRAKKLTDKIYIVTDASHAHHIKEQAPELPDDAFIVEPGRRGTASCIIAALAHLTDKHDVGEPVAFLHADHYIRDTKGFVHSLKQAGKISKAQERIVLVGIEPDYPATCFGYMKKAELFDEDAFVFNVHSFTEKPDYKVAKEYLKSGDYLWNAGYFVGSVQTFRQTMERYAPDLLEKYTALTDTNNKDDFEKTYLGFDNQAIDYALMEKADNLLMVPAAFDWMDLGSYGDLHKAVGGDEQGNHVMGPQVETEAVENSFIQNHEPHKQVAVIDLDNIVVINTPHGLLVARKDSAQKVGDVSKRFSN